MMSQNAGILFACRKGDTWEVCLARRAIDPGTGKMSTTGGRARTGEAFLDTAFRETKLDTGEIFGKIRDFSLITTTYVRNLLRC